MTTATPPRLPTVVYLLALGTFLMCTSEYLVAGLLPEMSADLHTSLATTGLLITAFAVGMIIGAPTMALATLRLPRRATLVLALAVFASGHVVATLSSNFALVLVARVVTALVTGAFWSVAAAVATDVAGPARSSRALGIMMSGVGLSTVVGVPVGSWTGQHLGWRGVFWGLAALAALAALVIGRLLPPDKPSGDKVTVGSQISVLTSQRLWVLLTAIVFVTGGPMATFSYISPLLTEHAGLPLDAVPLVLVGFGVRFLIGAAVAGRSADARPLSTLVAAATGTLVVMALIVLVSSDSVLAVVLIVALGLSGMAVPPVATGLAVRSPARHPASQPGWPSPASTAASPSGPGLAARHSTAHEAQLDRRSSGPSWPRSDSSRSSCWPRPGPPVVRSNQRTPLSRTGKLPPSTTPPTRPPRRPDDRTPSIRATRPSWRLTRHPAASLPSDLRGRAQPVRAHT